RLNLGADLVKGRVALGALVIPRVAFDRQRQTGDGLFAAREQRRDARLLVMGFGQFGVEFSRQPQMIQSRLQLTLDHVNYSGEVMGLSRLLLIAGPRVFGGLEEILQGLREIDDVVEVNLSDRTMDRVIGIVAFFGLQKIAERLFIPAVQISPFGARAISPGLALELGQADFFEDARERLLLHLQTPDDVAQ